MNPMNKPKDQLNNCPNCGSGDVAWCNISVRPYCAECHYWGKVNFGTVKDAIEDWNKEGAKMKIDDQLNIGDKVWAYDPPLRPLEATVKQVMDYGYRLTFEKKFFEFLESKTWSNHQIFRRPTDWRDLVHTLEDDAYTLTAASEELERKYRFQGE